MAKARKTAQADLPAQHDPTAPLDAPAFLRAAQPVLRRLTEDLLVRADASPHVTAALKSKHSEARAQHRTAEDYVVWRRAVVVQVAAAWLLSCVFIRVLEDRGLIHTRLAGPAAKDSEANFFQFAPSLSHREYLLTIFRELSRLPAAADLFDNKHNLVWRLAPSDAACKDLLQLFRGPSIEAPAFRFGQLDTRFLGDLYQDIDADTREFYALLQTPDFVESFILDHTLEPAIREYGIDNANLIDPTCGSGHFLLGAFPRFLDHLRRAHPAENDRELARIALDKICGVDINPYAASIARFRLFLKFVEVCEFRTLREATKPPIHVTPADSLLYGFAGGQGDFSEREEGIAAGFGEGFNLEDAEGARQILAKRRYTAVVGNPPYITVKDAALREKYRKRYVAAAGKYALSAPFVERFFALGKSEGGYIGQITSNSFMKREFGKPLIEKVLRELELTYIINTSGAYIPGHGTPTVILFGRNRKIAPHALRGPVPAVLAKRGEPGIPAIPGRGAVWMSITEHGHEPGFDNEYISVDTLSRTILDQHPWTLEGGGAGHLKSLLEGASEQALGEAIDSAGFMAISGEDDVFILPFATAQRYSLPIRDFGIGETVRDWGFEPGEKIVLPYSDTWVPQITPDLYRWLWPFAANLRQRLMFGKTQIQAGLEWFEYRHLGREKVKTSLSIAFAFVSTHNHFVLDRGSRVFKQTAPIIKLPPEASEDDHFALLAYLNSSTACFWLKQVAFNKGSRGQGGGLTSEEWEQFYEFTSTQLSGLPLPPWSLTQRREAAVMARNLMGLAEQRASQADMTDIFSSSRSATEVTERLSTRQSAINLLEARIRGAQETLDWWIYYVFGLAPSLTANDPPRAAGERLSDILFASTVAAGAMGRRYFELCRLPPPEQLAASSLPQTDALIHARTQARSASPALRLLETPPYKRTFREGFRVPDFTRKAESWLLAGLEKTMQEATAPQTVASLLYVIHARVEHVLLAIFPAQSPSAAIRQFMARESVPFFAGHRYAASGREKFVAWQQTWDLQRQADALDAVAEKDPAPENRHKAAAFRAAIPVPPKYDPADFRDGNFFRLRGKLDVPNERFISYPGCASDVDLEPVYGWAGWDHLQRALALFQLYYARKDEAWTPERLIPMLAGLDELLPWVRQWHAEARSPETGHLYHEYFDQVIASEAAELGTSRAALATWAPPERGAGRKPAKAKASSAEESDTEAPVTDATADAAVTPARKRRGKAEDPAAADTTDAAPVKKRKSKSVDKTSPASE